MNINWSLPLQKGNNGYFLFNETIQDAVKQNIQSVLFTRKGSRVIYKDYGTYLDKYLYEPRTVQLKSKIRIEIVQAINKWVKGVTITNLDILYQEDITPDTPYFSRITIDDQSVLVVIYYEIVANSGLFKLPNQSITLLLQN